MRRHVLRGLVGTLVVFGSLVVAAPTQAGDIRPFLHCVRLVQDPRDHRFSTIVEVFFGYVSDLTTTVTIPVGSNNLLFPGPQDGGQPTVFEPGVHDKVFSVRFQSSPNFPQLSWLVDSGGLEGSSASANQRDACDAPRHQGSWDATAQYRFNDLVNHNNARWVNTSLFPPPGTEPGVSGNWSLFNDRRLGLPAPLPTSQVFMFPRNGVLTIEDPNVTPNSVILLQYVGDRRSGEPRLVSVGTGQFTVRGARDRPFRYFVR